MVRIIVLVKYAITQKPMQTPFKWKTKLVFIMYLSRSCISIRKFIAVDKNRVKAFYEPEGHGIR